MMVLVDSDYELRIDRVEGTGGSLLPLIILTPGTGFIQLSSNNISVDRIILVGRFSIREKRERRYQTAVLRLSSRDHFLQAVL
jgi:Carbohydrate binding module 27